jgi:general secretion pathway protein G
MGKKTASQGFTLIEVIIVFTLIGILVGLALPQYQTAIRKANEATLKQNLNIMRTLINQYYTDKMQFPATLRTLVDEGYLRAIPIDPMTNSSETWIEIPEVLNPEDMLSGMEIPGIADVQSGSDRISVDGTPYSSW